MARMIICLGCDEEKEYHARGLCKTCYTRQYNQRYYQKNRGKILACHRAYQRNHEEKTKAYQCEWRKANRDKINAYHAQWAKDNPAKVRALQRRDRQHYPARARDKDRREGGRRKAQRQRVANTLTQEQIDFERKIGEATYPGEELHLHHLVSFNRKGGNTWGNIMFVPASLNCSIGDKLPQEVYRQKELF